MFGRRLSRARVDLKLKAQEVAERLGVGKNTVYSWEQGKTIPQRGRLAALADLLELDVNELEDLIETDSSAAAREQPQPRSEPSSNQLLLEVGGLRLNVQQSVPIYVHVTIGPFDPSKDPRPS